MKLLMSILLFTISILAFNSANAQLSNNNNLYQQGYNTGCELKQEYNVRLYNATISNQNFPQEYRTGVREGWATCSAPTTDGGGLGSDDIICRLFNNCQEDNPGSDQQ